MTRARTAAVAVAAVALLGGCSLGASDGDSAKPADDAHSRATAVSPSPAAAPVQWLAGSAAKMDLVTAPKRPITGAVPGAEIDQNGTCTLGAAVEGGYLTAGHCDDGDGTPVTLKSTGAVLGDFTDIAFSGYQPDKADGLRPDDETGLVLDAAVISAPTAAGATKLAGRFPVAGVLTADAVKRLPKGTVVCGGVSQGPTAPLECGLFDGVDSRGFIRKTIYGWGGDSGSPVFVISADNRAALIGVLSGTPENYGTALLDPALERLRAHVLLDPDFHPFEGADFSAWVTRAS